MQHMFNLIQVYSMYKTFTTENPVLEKAKKLERYLDDMVVLMQFAQR